MAIISAAHSSTAKIRAGRRLGRQEGLGRKEKTPRARSSFSLLYGTGAQTLWNRLRVLLLVKQRACRCHINSWLLDLHWATVTGCGGDSSLMWVNQPLFSWKQACVNSQHRWPIQPSPELSWNGALTRPNPGVINLCRLCWGLKTDALKNRDSSTWHQSFKT